jgi:hypothetical protein
MHLLMPHKFFLAHPLRKYVYAEWWQSNTAISKGLQKPADEVRCGFYHFQHTATPAETAMPIKMPKAM